VSEHYAWRGGEELLLRHGQGSPVTLVVLPALFEEANRMRRFTVSLMRGLAARGIGSVLPDLPGTGESLRSLADVTFADWQDAVGALADTIRAQQGRVLSVAVRGGAVLDRPADYSWRLAPEPGERILRDMVRATALSSGVKASDLDARARAATLSLAGNSLSPELYIGLQAATLPDGPRHTPELMGTRPWRAAEPGDDPALVSAAVGDILHWIETCGA
jgi:alpha-beta hydrolase superfamily lysophospholipase